MAYYSQERKAKALPKIKALFKQYGVKGSVSVDNHSSLVVTLKSVPKTFDFQLEKRGYQINTYWFHEHYSGVTKEFLTKLLAVMNEGNYDNSDIQSDYFDVGWYVNVNAGRWNKPLVYTE